VKREEPFVNFAPSALAVRSSRSRGLALSSI
jgi:hypothetical protein